jgi:hypothetical protein
MYIRSGINSGTGEVSEMGMAYDVLESAPYMLLSLFSLVLSAMTLIATAGILVTIPAHVMFAIHHMLRAKKHNGVNPTPNRGRPQLVAFALARERQRASTAVATPQEKKVA